MNKESPVGPADERLSTIRALLAKAEATEFPEEAATFRAKASELMARYAIDEALLWRDRGDGSRDAPEAMSLVLRRPYIPQQAVLVNEVANAFGCKAIRFVDPGAPTERVEVVGFGSDLRLVDALVTSLMVQMAHEMAIAQPESSRAAVTASWRRSFMMGFVDGVSRRLLADRAAAARDEPVTQGRSSAVGDRPPSVAVVLREREAEVDDEMRRRHPFIRHGRVGSGSSSHGRRSGHEAGSRADLGNPRLAARRGLPRG
jgi:Protein of unknown function (DUF2786)